LNRCVPRLIKAPLFDYARAESVDEAVEMLSSERDALILAGGQSLMPLLNMRLASPLLIDINRLDELGGIARRDGMLRIGALARHRDVADSPLVREHFPLIANAMRTALGWRAAQTPAWWALAPFCDPRRRNGDQSNACRRADPGVVWCRVSARCYSRKSATAPKGACSPALADYLLPMAVEMPDITVGHVSGAARHTDLGANGVGEAGVAGASGAVLNAVNDAISPFGARLSTLPMSPERILRALGRIP
jgi:hypothetical protein